MRFFLLNLVCVEVFRYVTVAQNILRISNGFSDDKDDYPYVILLSQKPIGRDKNKFSRCTGTLLSHEWVLTAGHCLFPKPPRIVTKYTNYTKYVNGEFVTTKHIFSTVFGSHTLYQLRPYRKLNDIGLLHITKFAMLEYGALSSIHPRLLRGQMVRYAGYGKTDKEIRVGNKTKKLFAEVLQTAVGSVIECPKSDYITQPWDPQMCVQPFKTDKGFQFGTEGDAGAPLFHYGEIFGVLAGEYKSTLRSGDFNNETIMAFTPVWHYLQWIDETMQGHFD